MVESGGSPLPMRRLATTSAAKLHVLNLAPIKAKLGGKWPKLSELVHKLFEKSIRESQSRRDHFIQVDELSYIVTFHGLAFQEASLACTAIAQEVCEKLFGGTESGISVRALVGELYDHVLEMASGDGSEISALLELNGQEILVTNNPDGVPATVTKFVPGGEELDWEPINTIVKARAAILPMGLEIGLFPVWDIVRSNSSCVYVSGYPAGHPVLTCTRRQLSRAASLVTEAEITLLYAAHAYAHRVRNSGRICAVGSAVSFETLTSFNARIRFVTALKSLSLSAECPVLLKLEDIPIGTPQANLAEMISMLAVPNLRFILQYHSYMAIPDAINIRLGAMGIGCPLPSGCDASHAAAVIKKLVRVVSSQKGFVFVEGLESEAQLNIAKVAGVRFGTGSVFGSTWLSGTEPVPSFPLTPS
jgi:hypothetical protein